MSEPSISVIVPVYNAGAHLGKCLDALHASAFPACEIIVVDDCSTDDVAPLNFPGLRLLRLDSRSGPAAARNHGANIARGDLLLFVDADVLVAPDTLGRIAMLLSAKPDVAAVFGSYDDSPAETNFVSQYKNLLHHYVHQQSSSEASTFWTACGAIRRDVFAEIGGFDEDRYVKPSIEDIELGYRLRRGGFRVVLDKELRVKHLKRWTFRSLLQADIFDRALPWSRLILERGKIINDLNLRFRERVCAALVVAVIGLAGLSYFSTLFLVCAFVALTAVFFINLRQYSFFKAQRGLRFAWKSFAMSCLYYGYSSSVFAICFGEHVLTRAHGIIRPDRTAPDTGLVKDA